MARHKAGTVLSVAIVAQDAARRAELAEIVAHAGHAVVDAGSADVVLLDAAASPEQIEAALQRAAGTPVPVVAQGAGALRARGFEELNERVASVLLTPRELEVLAGIGAGLSNKAIARELGISLHTVKFHIESLFRKLGARTRAEAVAKGLERREGETVEL
ncbi:MAG TPA: response regulator transcription factor [Steroidobacteraceae bacterium]|nr:response regulator transcription factor [Steroidobacteraceae bacterium]